MEGSGEPLPPLGRRSASHARAPAVTRWTGEPPPAHEQLAAGRRRPRSAQQAASCRRPRRHASHRWLPRSWLPWSARAAGRRRPCSARDTAAVEGTGRHGARGRREELAAGRPLPLPTRSARARRHHKARSLQPRRAGRRRPLRRERSSSGRRAPREPSVSFFSYFLEIEMLIGLYGLYLVMDSLNDLLDLLILYGRFNIW